MLSALFARDPAEATRAFELDAWWAPDLAFAVFEALFEADFLALDFADALPLWAFIAVVDGSLPVVPLVVEELLPGMELPLGIAPALFSASVVVSLEFMAV